MSDSSVPSTITFGGLSLHPVRYAEQSDEGITINLQATLTNDETLTLRGLPSKAGGGYFPVTVDGREPLSMRMGRGWWQRRGSDVEHNITLVSEDYDARAESPAWMGGDPQVENLMRMVAQLRRELDALLDAVGDDGLTAGSVPGIRNAGAAAWPADSDIFCEVSDLDGHWLGDEDNG
jgi:hypothetical protein